jgi:hypothetical protein
MLKLQKHNFPPICEWRLKTYRRMCKPPNLEQIKLKLKKSYHKNWADFDLRVLSAGNETVSISNITSDCRFWRVTDDGATHSELLVFGLYPSSGILGTRKHDVLQTGSVSVLRYVWGRKDTYSAGMINESSQPTQFGHFSYLDPPEKMCMA